MNPSTEQQLREKINNKLPAYCDREVVDVVLSLVIEERKAWGEYVIGEDFMSNDFDDRWVRQIPPNITHYETKDVAEILNKGFFEQRQRNQEEGK